MQKLRVGVLGATGAVGQNYVDLLRQHPWFEVTFLAASKESPSYEQAVAERGWFMQRDIPENMAALRVHEGKNAGAATELCDFIFSALDTEPARELEPLYARGLPVVSNAGAYRNDPLVPMLIPEINPQHLEVIAAQQRGRGYEGFIVVKPNCSLQSYLAPIYALMKVGYTIDRIVAVTLQAVSGAGRPGVSAGDITDNVLPFIKGEEQKTENEPLKILGSIEDGEIRNYNGLKIDATCFRVNVRDGHTAAVEFSFNGSVPSKDEILEIWRQFRGLPQEYGLPSAPARAIIYRGEENRPQPVLDRDNERGMAVTVGRLRQGNVFDYRFVGLSHNTIRGAAGGGILNAELLVQENYIAKKD